MLVVDDRVNVCAEQYAWRLFAHLAIGEGKLDGQLAEWKGIELQFQGQNGLVTPTLRGKSKW